MLRSWTIGALPDCDLVVDLPFVSGHHCRLTLDERGYSLEDLQSANGTYVNGDRISDQVRISTGDAITLGRTTPMPWPVEAGVPRPAVLRIGREPDNDLVISRPIISGHHARVVWGGKPGEATIEDLGSANGTAVGSPDRKMARSVFGAGDTIYLGTHPVSGAELLARVQSALAPAVAAPLANPREGASIREARSAIQGPPGLASTTGTPGLLIRDLALFLQAPIVAIAIGAISWSTLPAREGVATGEAFTLYWLGLAALWFGLSNAVLGDVLGSNRPRAGSLDVARSLRRVGRSAALGALQCLIAWIMVSRFSGPGGIGLPSLAFLILGSGVGLALGCLIGSLDLDPRMREAALALAMVSLWLFGGGPRALPRIGSWAKVVSNATPSRWAFEGLLLLESDRPAAGEAAASRDHPRGPELAEVYFPSDSERMGTRADAMALASMLLGLSAASLLLNWASRGDRAAPSTP